MSHSNRVICVDICNTIADITTVIEGIFGPIPNPLAYFHPKTPAFFWRHRNIIAEKIFKTAPPIEGAPGAINQLACNYKIIYLTARPEWAKDITANWLKKHNFPAGDIICTQDKYSWVRKNPVILMFEDDPRHIKKIQTLVPVFVLAQPWNKGLGIRFESWRDIFDKPQNRQFNLHRAIAIRGVEISV